MARPRQPTELLEVKGSFRQNPQRRRPVGPKTMRDLGPPPPHLSETEAAIWIEAIGNAPERVLTSGDRFLVETVSRLMAKFRADWLIGAEFGTLKACLTELGWTPASRSKITALPADEPEGEFSDFMQ